MSKKRSTRDDATIVDLTGNSTNSPKVLKGRKRPNAANRIGSNSKEEESATSQDQRKPDDLTNTGTDDRPEGRPSSEPGTRSNTALIRTLKKYAQEEQAIYRNIPRREYDLLGLTNSNSTSTTTSKSTIEIQGKKYEVYPDYARDDLLPLRFPGDELDPDLAAPAPRVMVGPNWRHTSCALDTFLWVSAVCDVHRLRSDFPFAISSEAQEKTSPLSQLVARYLRQPMSTRHQEQIDTFRNVIMTVMAQDSRMRFQPDAGMDITNLFEYAWGKTEEAHLHQMSWTQAQVRRCTSCPGYGVQRPRDMMSLHTPFRPSDETLDRQLQDYFDPKPQDRVGSCPYCHGRVLQQRVVLDRMPQRLLWMSGDNRCDDLVKQVLDPVTLSVDVAAEGHVGRQTIWQPRQMRVTYKPVVIVVSDTTTYAEGTAHWYAASCLPIKDGKGGWLLYDGVGTEQDPRLVTEVEGARLVEHISRKKDRVCVIIMQKLMEEKIE
ncbi:hypothetical protein BDV97DRAFT_365699 [Delphinella strobiligena]|nr:hypothetical protein BDV97DRAFT_365699 [Delphinella strobiligena]